MYPSSRALTIALEHLNLDPVWAKSVPTFLPKGQARRNIGRAARAEPPLQVSSQPGNIFGPLRCFAETKCAPGDSKGGGSARGSAQPQPPFGRILLVLFLPGQEKNIVALPGIFHSKRIPQPLWNVENFPVEKCSAKFPSTRAVDKLFFSTFALWRKKRCVSKSKGTFPHKFVLILLRLKNL